MGDAVSPYLAFPGLAEVKLNGRRGLVAAWVGGVEVYPSQRTGWGIGVIRMLYCFVGYANGSYRKISSKWGSLPL